ncbi:hypothetical protein [Bacillus wiedmannii]|uniref:hypothetical protein n=1 Tax=Bacillus wiedmannii TaxID=1890302 RepID=UPI003D99EC69
MSVITLGSKVDAGQLEESPQLKFLIKNNYLKVVEKQYVVCETTYSYHLHRNVNGCGEKNYLNGSENLNCKGCGLDISLEENEVFQENEIGQLDYKKIISDATKVFESQGIIIQEKSLGNYLMKVDDGLIPLVFKYYRMDKSLALELLKEGEGFFCIDIDQTTSLSEEHMYCRYYRIDEFFNISPTEVLNEVKYMPENSAIEKFYSNRENIHNRIKELSSSVSWQDFEGPIVDFIFKEIRKRPRKLVEYKYLIRNHPSYSIINIQVGGAGNTDYRQIDLNDYLEIFFDRKLIIDAKRFSTTEIDNGVLEKVEHHGFHDPSNPQRAIIITTKDKVKCWNEIENWKRTTGQYKIIVITPEILSHILCFFEITEELFGFLDKYK